MERSSRYLVGIDLGTTNSVVAYIDTANEGSLAQILPITQLVDLGEVRDLPALPSFLYFPPEEEIASGTLTMWDNDHPSHVVGVMAREQGALVPGRQVSSAKSWLSQSAIDRTADILPRDAEPPEPRISPIEASARYLLHLRQGWNQAIAGDPDNPESAPDPEKLFENQDIVLTVPASFDEEARELTVEAARRAGLQHLTLLEEPLAAFYAWIAQNRETLRKQVHDGDLILICDIGGGTSDFSLVRAHHRDDDVRFERTAIGEHLLLGGDNLDLALARIAEQKLAGAGLSLRQRLALRRACSAAKERLLSDDSLERVPINILGAGRTVVGQMFSTELTREEVLRLLTDGFLPLTGPGELPKDERTAGLREIGLPYASDPAITRHLAAFLRQAAFAMETGGRSSAGMVRPDAVLFNGGFCVPAVARERILDAVANWFRDDEPGWRPRVLGTEALASAVALGAAYYGRVRRGAGLRVKAGSARTYYIGMRSEEALRAVCVLPAGTDEGTTLRLMERDFSVLANRPVSFHLYSSRLRHDAHGAIAELHAVEIHRHAPLVTLLRYGKKLEQKELAVRLSVSFTEVGTLELWCESVSSPHRWRLQFELRREAENLDETAADTQRAATYTVSADSLEVAEQLVCRAFSKTAEGETSDPATLVSDLEAALDLKREAWPLQACRAIADVLLELSEGRRFSPRHEVRWLNMFGYCMRPGFGDLRDSARIAQTRKIYNAGLAFPRELQSQVDWLVMWRRLAAGLAAAHQHEIRNYLEKLGIGRKKPGTRLNAQVEHEGWRLLASLEHLSGATRAALAGELLRKLKKEPSDSAWLWSLGRFGARIPLYGPMQCVMSPDIAADWITALLASREFTRETASAIVQIGRRTGDRTRDVSNNVIERALEKFSELGISDDHLPQPLRQFVNPGREDIVRTFGEPLPRGLHLESTATCLSPVAALT